MFKRGDYVIADSDGCRARVVEDGCGPNHDLLAIWWFSIGVALVTAEGFIVRDGQGYERARTPFK